MQRPLEALHMSKQKTRVWFSRLSHVRTLVSPKVVESCT